MIGTLGGESPGAIGDGLHALLLRLVERVAARQTSLTVVLEYEHRDPDVDGVEILGMRDLR